MDGQGAQILQQVGSLLATLAQQEPEPTIQRGIMTVMKQLEPLMSLVGQDDTQDMSSGLATPNGAGTPPPPGQDPNDPTGGMGGGGGMPPQGGGSPMPGGPPDLGAAISSEGGGAGPGGPSEEPPSKSFGGAKAAAMANFKDKGHFSKSGSKGEELQTDRTKNRKKG